MWTARTATSLLVGTLRDLGRRSSITFGAWEESHGITIPYLQRVLDQGTQLILTCDTGISEMRRWPMLSARGVMS
jgi:single-stranded DNA-specific DHH superfamily exonuclease